MTIGPYLLNITDAENYLKKLSDVATMDRVKGRIPMIQFRLCIVGM